MISQYFNHDMDVIGHEAPCQQPIPIIVEMEERVLNQRSNLPTSQPTCAQPAVELIVDSLNGIGFSLQRLNHGAR